MFFGFFFFWPFKVVPNESNGGRLCIPALARHWPQASHLELGCSDAEEAVLRKAPQYLLQMLREYMYLFKVM